MRKFLCTFFCTLLVQFAFADIPERKVLLSLNPNEKIDWGEYVTNVKLSGFQYLCVLKNTSTKKEILIWNGQRKIVADDIWVVHADVEDFSKCIYTYRVGESSYLQYENESFGPYESVWTSDYFPMMAANFRYPNTNYIKRGKFSFKQMNEYYVHDNDGIIYKENDGRFDFESTNKQHHATLRNDKRVITIDGVNYVLPIPIGGEIANRNYEVCLFDDGTCYFTCNCWIRDYSNWVFLCYYITPSEFKVINIDTEYLDLETHDIKPKSALKYYIPFFSKPMTRSKETNEYYVMYEFLIQDSTKKHVLTAKWDHDYVLIDGKKYGNQCPIEAFYDKTAHSFGWVTIEDNKLVLNSLKL